MKDILARATGYSAYSYEDTLKCGWIPLPKGGRMGVAAHLTANGIREVSSLCLRKPFPHDAIDEKEFLSIYPAGFINTLILSPPGWGKTTLLRSLIHMLSLSGRTVGVADERMEIAGMSGGIASFELGDRVDVISGGRKGDAIMMLMRSMAPEIIAFDEITAKEDIAFAEEAAFCGVGLLSTAHAASKDDLMKRRLYKELLDSGVYEMAIEIKMENGGRRYRVEKL